MGRRPSFTRLARQLLALVQDRRELEKPVEAYKKFPSLREKFELQVWALYGMLHWQEQKRGAHPGWAEGLLRIAKECDQSSEPYADSVLSLLRDSRHHGTSDE